LRKRSAAAAAAAAAGRGQAACTSRLGLLAFQSRFPHLTTYPTHPTDSLLPDPPQVVREGFNPEAGLFQATTDNRLYPNPHAQVGWG